MNMKLRERLHMRRKSARFLALVLALVLSLGTVALAAGSLSNFQKVNTFQDGQFWDVSSGHWAYSNVRSAYEYGLMKGESDTAFAPDGGLTIAAAITLAARIHSIYYTGTENFVQGNPWYRCYVDYALENGLITGEYADYDAAIQRWEFAQILGRALPDAALPDISTVDDGAIPTCPCPPATPPTSTGSTGRASSPAGMTAALPRIQAFSAPRRRPSSPGWRSPSCERTLFCSLPRPMSRP